MQAPFHADLAEAPPDGSVIWRTARDGVRLRIGLWPVPKACGTILLIPGRTEYIEKYGRVIRDLTAQSYAVAVVDLRGQGYSDRLADDPALGHVGTFSDYQLDVAELVTAASDADLPKPYFLLAHSLGGNIGLRALIEGLNVERAVFSAPMWGIQIPAAKRLSAAFLPTWARMTGKRLEYLPGAGEAAYVAESGFDGNLLTTDRNHFDYFKRQLSTVPQFALGGPSVHWFLEAQAECARLASESWPNVPTQIYVGTLEGIVDASVLTKMHSNWPSAELTVINDARHELMMESPKARKAFLDGLFAFLKRPRRPFPLIRES
ncbi:MAG: alpha/beta hydrolase [Silicimonas sp.]|nr:alpha/beta hydrolase [Silicimonas sp.]